MPNRKESQNERFPLQTRASEPANPRIRIGRACDRCKIKKSKCDGNTPCSLCLASDSACEYSARRRREARDWYWNMQDVIDEALQKLYWACREGRGFPGVVPDEGGGRVSTDSILRGLGLSPPAADNARPSASQSDSTLDSQGQLVAPRLYHPPDVRPQTLGKSRNTTASSSLTPLSANGDDRVSFGDGTSSKDRGGGETAAMDLDDDADDSQDEMSNGFGEVDSLPNGLADSLPDGLGDGLRVGMDGQIDPSMMQGGHGGYMGGSMYSNIGTMPFANGLPLNAQGQQRPMHSTAQFRVPTLGQQRAESVMQSLGTVEQQVWQGAHDQEPLDTFVWPENMPPAPKRKKARDGGRGFDRGVDG